MNTNIKSSEARKAMIAALGTIIDNASEADQGRLADAMEKWAEVTPDHYVEADLSSRFLGQILEEMMVCSGAVIFGD